MVRPAGISLARGQNGEAAAAAMMRRRGPLNPPEDPPARAENVELAAKPIDQHESKPAAKVPMRQAPLNLKKQSAPQTAVRRLRQDYLRLMNDPIPYVTALPNPSNILEWHYIVRGPDDSPYKEGLYHGKLVFPRDYPFKPPSIYMLTPNGRFKTGTRLCLSISDFHPDTWNPAWSVGTILTGLLSFMLENQPTLGSIVTTDAVKRQHAYQSVVYNRNNETFCEMFPDIIEELDEVIEDRERQAEIASAGTTASRGLTASGDGNISDSRNDRLGVFNHFILLVAVGCMAYVVHMVLTSDSE